jgi:hypothetical protein
MTQQERILEHLKAGNTLTRLNCWNDLGVLEAPARISELRAAGHDIHTEMVEVINRYGEKVKIARWSMPERQCDLPW